MAHVAEMQKIERAVGLDHGLAGAPGLLAGRRNLGQGADLVARAWCPADRRLWDQFCDA
jgi:hypothetical protein